MFDRIENMLDFICTRGERTIIAVAFGMAAACWMTSLGQAVAPDDRQDADTRGRGPAQEPHD